MSAKLHPAVRSKLPDSAFAWPEVRRFPIDTDMHVRESIAGLDLEARAGRVSAYRYRKARAAMHAACERLGIFDNEPAAIENPKPRVGKPRWVPLLVRGKVNAKLRDSIAGKSGAYAVRSTLTGEVLYVGESHSNRLWKTMLRHFHGRASFARPSAKTGGETRWTWGRPDLVEVSVWLSEPGKTSWVQDVLIERLQPSYNTVIPAGLFEVEYGDETDEIPF